MTEVVNQTVAGIPHKRHRKRTKQLYNQIRQQMEFYFSDANLAKDRFLKQQIDESVDGYLPLELFLKFNKIRSLTSDIDVIAKALSSSQLLLVTKDSTKLCRSTEFVAPKDVDDRTVYVECLPAKANHDWVRNAFTDCGKVLYVSLPKYKGTGDIKGFAFVEFDSVESAARACSMMNNPPATAPELAGIFPRGSKAEKLLEKQVTMHEIKSGGRKRRASEGALDASPTLTAKANKRSRTRSISRGLDNLRENANIVQGHHSSENKIELAVSSTRHSSEVEPQLGSTASVIEQGKTVEESCTNSSDSAPAFCNTEVVRNQNRSIKKRSNGDNTGGTVELVKGQRTTKACSMANNSGTDDAVSRSQVSTDEPADFVETIEPPRKKKRSQDELSANENKNKLFVDDSLIENCKKRSSTEDIAVTTTKKAKNRKKNSSEDDAAIISSDNNKFQQTTIEKLVAEKSDMTKNAGNTECAMNNLQSMTTTTTKDSEGVDKKKKRKNKKKSMGEVLGKDIPELRVISKKKKVPTAALR